MIRFALRCRDGGHGFEAWFRSGADYERQDAAKLLECPECGSHSVEKALMRPAVSVPTSAATSAPTAVANDAPPEFKQMMQRMQEMARELRRNADYVGEEFAEEARRIHYGESEERRIYGEASGEDVRSLLDEGIAAIPLPPLPEDRN